MSEERVDRKQANMAKLQEIDETQNKTKEAIWRIQRQAAEAEETGAMTLEELRKQGQQMVRKIQLISETLSGNRQFQIN